MLRCRVRQIGQSIGTGGPFGMSWPHASQGRSFGCASRDRFAPTRTIVRADMSPALAAITTEAKRGPSSDSPTIQASVERMIVATADSVISGGIAQKRILRRFRERANFHCRSPQCGHSITGAGFLGGANRRPHSSQVGDVFQERSAPQLMITKMMMKE